MYGQSVYLSSMCDREDPRQSLPSTEEVVTYVNNFMDEALRNARDQTQGRDGIGRLSRACLQDVRDACMLGMLCCHVALTVRLSTIRTLHTSFLCSTRSPPVSPCTYEGCIVTGCKGNRLERVMGSLGQSLMNQPATTTYRLLIPHHKNSNRGQSIPPIPITSRPLSLLLQLWEEVARPQVC